LIREHLKRRPKMRAADVYKMLYQGVFGVRHLMSEGAWDRLEAEARTLGLDGQPGEPLIEEVSADGSMVRVNLRPYLRRGLPLDRLFSAMEVSAMEEGETEKFIKAWSAFKELSRPGGLVFDEGEIGELDKELEGGCRPRHHSEAYRRAYAPAYRVVRRSVLERVFDADELGKRHLT